MLRTDTLQVTIWDTVLPEELRSLPEELAKVDAMLNDARFVEPFSGLFDKRLGRPSTPVASLIRLMYLKHRYDLGYETLVREVSDSFHWRRFCHFGLADRVPDATTLIKLVQRAGPGAFEELNRRLVHAAKERKLIRGKKMRIDSTVVEADIHYPTDASLLADGVRVITRAVKRLQALGVATRTKVPSRTRSVKKRLYAISKVLRRRSGEAVKEVRRITGDIADIAEKALADGERVLRNGRHLAWREADRVSGKAKALLHRLSAYTRHLRKAISQARQVNEGNLHLPERLVSLFDPDARPIAKGKAGKPAEFGYKVQIEETDHGIITGAQVYRGNPGDPTLINDGVRAHTRSTGRRPKEMAADRGYYDAKRERALRRRGIRPVIPKRGRKSRERTEFERTAAFRRLQRWRAGGEARISLLKRKYGFRRSRLRGWRGVATWVHAGIFAQNLHQMAGLV